MAALTFLIGFLMLLLGGEATLRGAVGLGRALGLPKFLIGMVIIGIGTSLPELTIAVEAVTSGFSNLAVGNVLGSSIANTLLVLGVAALISSSNVRRACCCRTPSWLCSQWRASP